jgi:hypothetical protein
MYSQLDNNPSSAPGASGILADLDSHKLPCQTWQTFAISSLASIVGELSEDNLLIPRRNSEKKHLETTSFLCNNGTFSIVFCTEAHLDVAVLQGSSTRTKTKMDFV